jgi:signal transduction histidine kinase
MTTSGSPSPSTEKVGSANARDPDRPLWRYSRVLAVPLLIFSVLVAALILPVLSWLEGEDEYDKAAMQEWIDEARNSEVTLADLVGRYVAAVNEYARLEADGASFLDRVDARERIEVAYVEIGLLLRALGEPVTKAYPNVLPLFPVVFRMEVTFDPKRFTSPTWLEAEGRRLDEPVVWDSGQETSEKQVRTDVFPLKKSGTVTVRYQLHTSRQWQRNEQRKAQRGWQLRLLALAAAGLGLAWLLAVQAHERKRQQERERAREDVDQAERHRLDEERRRTETERQLLEQKLATQEEERRRTETERQLLEQTLLTQKAETQALELKSHLYASIGIMAGSYAHNIKNLLVRPNDLLRRLLEAQGVAPDQGRMLREVQQTLGTVTERLQQILQTVRRDPSQSALEPMDLNDVVRSLGQTWADLAADRWQLDLTLDLAQGPLTVAADSSHLTQAVENLLFNARDATFEMRNHLRDAARKESVDAAARRQKVIEAAGWRGKIVLRTRRAESGEVVLEVGDNGAGMTEEVRRRCTETHFSTKRDNALYQGHSTGMGLGLSFVVAILEHHRAGLGIESRVHQGTNFRATFPAAQP